MFFFFSSSFFFTFLLPPAPRPLLLSSNPLAFLPPFHLSSFFISIFDFSLSITPLPHFKPTLSLISFLLHLFSPFFFVSSHFFSSSILPSPLSLSPPPLPPLSQLCNQATDNNNETRAPLFLPLPCLCFFLQYLSSLSFYFINSIFVSISITQSYMMIQKLNYVQECTDIDTHTHILTKTHIHAHISIHFTTHPPTHTHTIIHFPTHPHAHPRPHPYTILYPHPSHTPTARSKGKWL